MKKRVLACILAAALLTTGIPGEQAAMAQSLTETGTEMATEEVNPENILEETEAASVTETEAQTSTERETEDVAGGSESPSTETEETEAAEETEAPEGTGETEETEETEAVEKTERLKSSGTVVDEALEEDPQAGTSMSNEEPESTSNIKSSSATYSGYTGSSYIHNGRYDSGYKIVNGIDVSYHNGDINWSAVKAAGIDYALIRVGYRGMSNGGLFDDSKYQANIQGALNAGLRVGVYIFSQATTQAEAVEEANYLLNRISGYNITLPVVIDYEFGANHSGRLADANLDIDTATAVVNAFCTTVQSAGYTPMVYANKTMLQSYIRGEILDDYYKIWLANYTTQTTYAGEYYAWQYSSKGGVSGISGYVDCNFFYIRDNYQNAQLYVTRLYENLLEREPDASGMNAYATAISNGMMTAADVAVDMISSSEFKNKNYTNQVYVRKLYAALFARSPQDSEVSNWVEVLSNGVSQKYVLKQLIESSEFTTVCSYYMFSPGTVSLTENRDQNYNATAYVMRCYRKILSRDADVSGLNTWTGKLIAGNGGAEIVKDLVMSEEFHNMNKSDAEFVDILYAAMLDRSSDESGKNTWLSTLNDGVSYVYVINGFAGSTEFGNICSGYGITPGQAEITEARDKNIKVTQYVNRCYEKALGRTGETDGINYWCSIILSGAQSPKDVAYGFVFSQESENQNRNNADYTEMLYNLCLGRASEAAGKTDWVGRLEQGTSREEVYWGFANSQEFENIIASYGL